MTAIIQVEVERSIVRSAVATPLPSEAPERPCAILGRRCSFEQPDRLVRLPLADRVPVGTEWFHGLSRLHPAKVEGIDID